MERIRFACSLKNIPIPSRNAYQLLVIYKIESVIKRIRWKVHFFLINIYDTNDNMNKETYGFKSKTSPWHYKRIRDV